MNRMLVGLLLVVLAVGTVTLAGGCGDEEATTRARIPESRLKPQRSLEDLTPEERAEVEERQKEVMHELLIWPEGQGERRDLDADANACREAAMARRDIANANPLVQMTWHTRCMAEKGWVLNPDAELPQS